MHILRADCTRSVRAIQRGKNIFFLTCSFQVPETTIPGYTYALPLPKDIYSPENSTSVEDRLARQLASDKISPKMRDYLQRMMDDRAQSSTEV